MEILVWSGHEWDGAWNRRYKSMEALAGGHQDFKIAFYFEVVNAHLNPIPSRTAFFIQFAMQYQHGNGERKFCVYTIGGERERASNMVQLPSQPTNSWNVDHKPLPPSFPDQSQYWTSNYVHLIGPHWCSKTFLITWVDMNFSPCVIWKSVVCCVFLNELDNLWWIWSLEIHFST